MSRMRMTRTLAHDFPRARLALEKSPVRLVQLLANVAMPQMMANTRKGPLQGTWERHVRKALRVGTRAELLTPADHIRA